ncbi:MAG: phosphatase PAP2 family protein [Lachnospiraceae bacterium]|nr:phosphatase PAP2 family protein [Lachnospiraceae bacterium]
MEWEFSFLYALQELHNPIMDKIMTFITRLGDDGILWIAIGVMCLFLKKYRKMGWQVLLSMLFTFIIGNLILKNIFARPRPCAIDPSVALLIPYPSEFSFPSGHSMNGMTAAIALFLNNKKIGIFAIVLAVCIGFSRMYHFVHFPTDVLGGFLVGSVVAISVHFGYEKWQNKKYNL